MNENYETAYIRIIEMAVEAKEYSDAWKMCKEAAKRFPESPRVYGSRGYLECAEHNYANAVKDCTSAIELKKDRWYYNTRGRALWKLNRVYEALMDFHEAHRLDPNYSPSIQNLNILCQEIGLDNIAKMALQKKQENDHELCKMYLECLLIADEKNETAKKELEKLQRE